MRPLSLARASVLILLLGLTSQLVLAQAPAPSPTPTQPPPVQDPQAIAAIQSAIAATGGITAISAIQSSIAQGTSVATPDDNSGTTNFTWTHSGQDFQYENDASIGSHTFASVGGSTCDLEGGNTVQMGSQVARATPPFHIPGLVLLNELNNSNYTLTYIGATVLNGVSAVHVQTADNSDTVSQLVTPQDWYFDAQSGIPLRVEFRIPSAWDAQTWQSGSMNFANYQTVSGVLVPFQLTITEGPLSVSVTVSSVTMNAATITASCTTTVTTTSGSAQ